MCPWPRSSRDVRILHERGADHVSLGVRAMGPSAALVECAPGEAAHLAVQAAARGVVPGHNGVIEVVPAAATILIECTDPGALSAAIGIIDGLRAEEISWARRDLVAVAEPDEIEIPVRFDGPDLDLIAERIDLAPQDVITAVTGSRLEVAFCGFAPGFAYLTGLDPRLHVPRRDRPRPRVPRGSFAIAAGYAAIYPSSSPGGWHLLGSTGFEVWSLARRPPAALRPGTRVRIILERDDVADPDTLDPASPRTGHDGAGPPTLTGDRR